jgi:hypothetical protein
MGVPHFTPAMDFGGLLWAVVVLALCCWSHARRSVIVMGTITAFWLLVLAGDMSLVKGA